MSPYEASAPADKRALAPRWRATLVWLAVCLSVLAAIIAGLDLGAPGFVRSEILRTIAQKYHRTAHLDRVRLDPLRLHAEFDGFDLPDRDGRTMLGFRRLNAGLSWPSLLIGKIVFDDLALDGPQVRVVRRPDGRVNLADLVLQPQRRPPSVRIAHLRLTGGRADLVDEMRPEPFEKRFDPISFSLRNFTTTANGAAYSLSAESDEGERLSWRGVLGVAPVASKGSFTLVGWRADRLATLMQGALPLTLASGLLDVRGDYDLALPGKDLRLQADLDKATLRSVAIKPKSGAGSAIRADALTVSGVRFDLGRRAVSVAHVVLSRPQVDVRRDRKGAINLAAFATPRANAEARAGAPERSGGAEAPGWTVAAPDIRVEHGEASIGDRMAPEPVAWVVDPVDLTVSDLAYPLARPLQIAVHAEADDGSTLDVKGPLTLPGGAGRAPSGRFDIALIGVEINRFQPYIGRIAKVAVVGGDASARGRLELSPAGAQRFTGKFWVDSLRAVDPRLKSDLVTWDKLTATGVRASSKPFDVRIARILADGAYGSVVLEPNYVFNIRAVLEQQETPAPGAATLTLQPRPTPKSRPKTSAPPPAANRAPPVNLPIDVDRIDFTDGRMDFTDLTLRPQFATGVQNISGAITGLSARAGVRARVDLKGAVDPFAPVTIAGTLDPFGPDRFFDMVMAFHNMELTTFSPYSGKFAGYRIESGKINVDLRYQIENQKIDAKHHVVINRLQLGEKVDSADATKLPVKLIIALLKDRNGVIDVPIDFTGSLDDPKFRIWPVIWKIAGNLFGKIIASPFAMLGHLVGHGGGGEALGKIEFQPGSAALPPAETDKISVLAKALDERPGLGLEIPETVAPDLDGPVLTQAAYQDSLQAAYRTTFKRPGSPPLDQVLATPKLKLKVLEAAYRQSIGQPPTEVEKAAAAGAKNRDAAAAGALETALQTHVKADDRAMGALAQARAQAVETALVDTGHIDAKRIFLVTAPPLKTGPITMAVALK
jgi:uncharacterized protein involved in outer membrane biogenesis